MELKFLLLTFLVLFAVFESIESKYRSGSSRGSSSRGSSSRGSSSRGSSSRGSSWGSGSSSHGSSWGSGSSSRGSSWGSGSTSHGTSWGTGSTNRGSSSGYGSSNRGTNSPGTSSHGSGSFLNSERGHVSNTGHNSPYRPFATVPPTPWRNTGSHTNNSPFKPFPTVPPAPSRNTGSHTNNSPFKPFPTVPPAPSRNTGSHTNNSPFKPFPTVPPAPSRNTGNSNGHHTWTPAPPMNGYQKPTAPPPGFVPSVTATRVPSVYHPRPNYGHTGNSSGFSPPPPGFKPSVTRPPAPVQPTHYPTHSRNTSVSGFAPPAPGFHPSVTHPTAPIQPTYYPTQGSHPGGSASHYPVQPPYNPSFSQPSAPVFSPYPGHQSTQTFVPPSQVHIHHNYAPVAPPQHSVPTVVMVPGSSGYSRSTGDIFKEALIHAGVNAAVNRLTSPSHYYGNNYHSSWSSYGPPPLSGQTTVTHTNTHITNNYYDQTPGSSGTGVSGINPSNNYNPQSYPSGNQGGSWNSFNTQGNNGYNGNNGNSGNTGNSGISNPPGPPVIGNSNTLSNGHSSPSQSNGGINSPVGISDQDILNITEKLFSLDENNAVKYIVLNLQQQVDKNITNVTDLSPQPLFAVDEAAYKIPTIKAIRSLYQSAIEIENKTRTNSRKEEALFVDLILNTNVMIAAMDFLAEKNLISTDYYVHRDMLKHIWFTPYDGSSSGFKRVFQGDTWEGILWGIQDWIAFDFQEKAGRANYFSYSQKLDLGKAPPKPSLLKVNFEMGGNTKAGTQLFVGTSPELQMALYTICAYTRPFYQYPYCNVSLGGTTFPIYTHTDRYSGKDLINAAFPLILE